MKRIRVIRGGCGICYTDAHGVNRHVLKTPESGSFECSDEQAERLVRLGVAVYTGDASKALPKLDAIADQGEKGYFDAEELEDLDYSQLKRLAADIGAEPKGRKKEDLIEAILQVEAEADDSEGPVIDAMDPVS